MGGETDHLSFGGGGFHRDAAQEAAFLSDLTRRGAGAIVLARSALSGQLVGSGAAISRGRRSGHVFQLSVVVRRDHWRRGIGSGVMRRLEEEARWATRLLRL